MIWSYISINWNLNVANDNRVIFFQSLQKLKTLLTLSSNKRKSGDSHFSPWIPYLGHFFWREECKIRICFSTGSSIYRLRNYFGLWMDKHKNQVIELFKKKCTSKFLNFKSPEVAVFSTEDCEGESILQQVDLMWESDFWVSWWCLQSLAWPMLPGHPKTE